MTGTVTVDGPGRNIPRTMIGGVLLVMSIYLALNIAFVQVVMSLIASVNALVLMASRVPFAMSRNRLLSRPHWPGPGSRAAAASCDGDSGGQVHS